MPDCLLQELTRPRRCNDRNVSSRFDRSIAAVSTRPKPHWSAPASAARTGLKDDPDALPTARTYVPQLPADVQEWTAWRAAALKPFEAADGGDVDAAVLQLALFTAEG